MLPSFSPNEGLKDDTEMKDIAERFEVLSELVLPKVEMEVAQVETALAPITIWMIFHNEKSQYLLSLVSCFNNLKVQQPCHFYSSISSA